MMLAWWKTMYSELFEMYLIFFSILPFYSLAIIRSVNFRSILKDICFIIIIVLFDKQIVKMQK